MPTVHRTSFPRRASVAAAFLAASTAAGTALGQGTDQPLAIVGYYGLMGSADADSLEVDGLDGADPVSEDFIDHYGIAGLYLPVISPRVRVGARFAYLTANGEDDPDTHYADFALGPWFRFEALTESFRPFGDVGIGVNALMVNGDGYEAAGFGFHFTIGVGVALWITDGFGVNGGLYYAYHAYPNTTGDVEVGDQSYDVEGSFSLQRGLLAVGLQF
jgi:hypothetical protein